MNTTKKHILLAGLALLSLGALHAEPVKLTRIEASDLYVALSGLEAGLTPSHTVAAADNLNALRPQVESLDKGRISLQRGLKALTGADIEQRATDMVKDFEDKAAEETSFDLQPLLLSDEELTAVKLKPLALATLRRLLPQKPSATK